MDVTTLSMETWMDLMWIGKRTNELDIQSSSELEATSLFNLIMYFLLSVKKPPVAAVSLASITTYSRRNREHITENSQWLVPCCYREHSLNILCPVAKADGEKTTTVGVEMAQRTFLNGEGDRGGGQDRGKGSGKGEA